jgi:hypothetical protein
MVSIKIYNIDLTKHRDRIVNTRYCATLEYAQRVARRYNTLFSTSHNIATIKHEEV